MRRPDLGGAPLYDALDQRNAELQRDLRLIGLSLAACDKAVQIIYERALRPPEKRHEPWVARVGGQLLAAWRALDDELLGRPLTLRGGAIRQAGVTAAVAWHFTQQLLPELVPATDFPSIDALSAEAETHPAFQAAAHGEAACRP